MTQRRKTISRLLAPCLLTFALAPTGCAADGLIGGECAVGYEFCADQCISITDDEANCGGCDIACPRNLACVDALCGGPDGTATVPGSGGGSGTGGAPSGTGGGFGGLNTGAGGPGGNEGSGGAIGGSGGSGGECTAPFDTPAACGDCDTQCSGNTSTCAPDGDGSYECVATCTTDPFLTECDATCVDTTSDPRHCGSCNNRCDSGICLDSMCVGSTYGHKVALCMSFQTSSPSQTALLGNAVFLATRNPVRILSYTRETSTASINGTNQALTSAAAARGRTFERTNVTGLNAITNQLTREDYDVLIICDQQNAPAGQMAARATAWSPAIDTFTELGGVVVVLTGGGGTSEVHELIEGLGIVNSSGTLNNTDNNYVVSAPGDALAIGLVSPFLAVDRSCVFDGTPPSDSETVYVLEGSTPGPANGLPGAVHRIVAP